MPFFDSLPSQRRPSSYFASAPRKSRYVGNPLDPFAETRAAGVLGTIPGMLPAAAQAARLGRVPDLTVGGAFGRRSIAEQIGVENPSEQQIRDYARFGTGGTPTGRRQRYFDTIAQAQQPAQNPGGPRTTAISNQEILDSSANALATTKAFTAGSGGNYTPTRSGRGIMPTYLSPSHYREAGMVGNTPLDVQRMQPTNPELAAAAAAGQPLAPRAYFGSALQDLQMRPQRLDEAQARKAAQAMTPLPTDDPAAMLARAQSGDRAARQFLVGQKAQAKSEARRRRMGNLSNLEAMRFGVPDFAASELAADAQRNALANQAQQFAAQNQLGWAGAYNNLLGTIGQNQVGQFETQAAIVGALPELVAQGLVTPMQAQQVVGGLLAGPGGFFAGAEPGAPTGSGNAGAGQAGAQLPPPAVAARQLEASGDPVLQQELAGLTRVLGQMGPMRGQGYTKKILTDVVPKLRELEAQGRITPQNRAAVAAALKAAASRDLLESLRDYRGYFGERDEQADYLRQLLGVPLLPPTNEDLAEFNARRWRQSQTTPLNWLFNFGRQPRPIGPVQVQ